jgi:hypothetical protein
MVLLLILQIIFSFLAVIICTVHLSQVLAHRMLALASLLQGLANFFYKGSGNDYFRLQVPMSLSQLYNSAFVVQKQLPTIYKQVSAKTVFQQHFICKNPAWVGFANHFSEHQSLSDNT